MKLITITANSAAEALAEVHRQLGPNAVIVNVRKIAPPGLGGIFKKPQVEVQAAVPNQAVAPAQAIRGSRSNKQEWVDLHKKVTQLKKELDASADPGSFLEPRRGPISPVIVDDSPRRRKPKPDDYAARVRASLREARDQRKTAAQTSGREENVDLNYLLESLGILPLHAQWLVDQVRAWQGDYQFQNLREEFAAVQEVLIEYWNRLQERTASRPSANLAKATRILVGPPGVGKSTCICKWVTQEVLLQNQKARIWRLDTHSANTAEFLSIHGEILGIPVERVWTGDAIEEVPLQFVDFPGVPIDDTDSIQALKKQIDGFKPAQVLLVLNAAYELEHLMTQARAFSILPLSGLVLTHTDEENRWSKFWNLFLGTKLPMAFLSGGQNIPGNFFPATPQALFEVEAGEPVSR